MNELEIKKLTEESEKITEIERAQVAEYAKLSYLEKLARREGFVNCKDYKTWLAQQKGFTGREEYETMLAQKKGFANRAEYNQDKRFKRGIGTGLSMVESRNSALYLGIYIAERLLPKIFQEPKMMPHGNKGYDAICKNNYKIDVKSSVLSKSNFWSFHIGQNKIADAFICIAFDNRDDLNLQHIWLIPGKDIIQCKKLNEKKRLNIHDTEYGRASVTKYELVDKLDDANDICILYKTGFLR